jgi:hypothetical protein
MTRIAKLIDPRIYAEAERNRNVIIKSLSGGFLNRTGRTKAGTETSTSKEAVQPLSGPDEGGINR